MTCYTILAFPWCRITNGDAPTPLVGMLSRAVQYRNDCPRPRPYNCHTCRSLFILTFNRSISILFSHVTMLQHSQTRRM